LLARVGANAVDEDPGHVVEFVFNQQSAQFFQPLDANVGAVVQDADLFSAQVIDQVTPFGDHTLRAAAAPFDGHDALAAEGAAVGTAAAGHDAEATCAVDMIGGRLQVGVVLHLEEW
jgi:hypothetical protein